MNLRGLLVLVAAVLLGGCTTAPKRSDVVRVRGAAIKAEARRTGLPKCDYRVRSFAKDDLKVSATCLWVFVPPSQSVSDSEVGRAIERALPLYSLTKDYIRILNAAASLLP